MYYFSGEYVPRSRIPWRIKIAARRFSREQILAMMYKMDRENESKSYSTKSKSQYSKRGQSVGRRNETRRKSNVSIMFQ